MVIKIRKKNHPEKDRYKGAKQVLTPSDIIIAEKQDLELKVVLKKIENSLIKKGFLTDKGRKKDPLRVWYAIGAVLNDYLSNHKFNKEDENYFWKDLYERDTLLHNSSHKRDIGETRNDYKIAFFLASKYTIKELEGVGSWALVREIFSYKNITKDLRIVDYVIKELVNKPRSRNDARPLLKNISNRFKFMKTNILIDKELLEKLIETTNSTNKN